MAAAQSEVSEEAVDETKGEDGGDVDIDLEGEDADLKPVDMIKMALSQITLMLMFGDCDRATAMMDDLQSEEIAIEHRGRLCALQTECRERRTRYESAGSRADLSALDLNALNAAPHSKSSDNGMDADRFHHNLAEFEFDGISQFMPTTRTVADC